MNINGQSESQNPFDIRGLLNAIILRRYVFIGVMLTVITASVIVSYSMKKMYRAETIVLVEAPSIANPLAAKSSSVSRVQQRLSLIKQLLFNRSSMAKVIRKLDLDLNIKNPYQYEALIAKVQKNLYTTTRKNNLFKISYMGEDPKVVRDIVNTLAAQYIEDSFQSKRSGVSLSTDFYNDQIFYYKERLSDAENAVNAYLAKNPTMVLRSPDVKLARVQSMQTSLMDLKMQRKELQARLDMLNDQLSGKTPLSGTVTLEGGGSSVGRLEMLEEHLATLLLKYTESYPEVLRIKGEIAELNKGLGSTTGKGKTKEKTNPVRKQVQNEAGKIKNAIAMLDSREREIENEIVSLETALSEVPAEAQVMVDLRREVHVYEGIYNNLVTKFEAVKITKELEQREEPFIFKVITPAVLPIRPVKPDRVLFIIIGLIAGIGAGVGVVFLWENYLDTSIKNLEGLKESIGRLPVLAAIPNIVTDEVKKKTRKRDIWVFSATAVYLAFVGLILLLELASKYGLEVL
jgi:polysaccharide chain length determinant protein (PEP-CTERM system associated)